MKTGTPGFSLAEIMIAIGILTFAIFGLVSMLPVGMNLAQNSTEEIQGANLISAIVSDLQSSPPSADASACFKLKPLPWMENGAGSIVPNSAITAGKPYVFYFSDGQTVVASNARYRVTVQYTRVPGQPDPSGNVLPLGSPAAIEAIAVVTWPAAVDPFTAVANANPPQGQVETYLTFPRP